MSIVSPKGNPAAPVYVIINTPLPNDFEKGYVFSSGMGYVFDKMMHEAGIEDYYVTARKPDPDNTTMGGDWESYLQHHKPPIIITLDGAGRWLCNELDKKHRTKANKEDDSDISKYAGSLLTSPRCNWPHYVIPTYGPAEVIKQWKMRDIVINCDLAKAASELEWWKTHAYTLQPLPIRNYKVDFDNSFDELLAILESYRDSEILSTDIETIYPRPPTKTQPSQFYKILPGYPVCVGLASDINNGISFKLFRDSTVETRELWKKLAILLKDTPQVGQNYFNFDANFFESLGFKIPLEKCRDTMIMHHLLWAELPHKLQFLARQYTREVYWKDEGAGWAINNMRGMMIYNVKDVCVTLEIFQKELAELAERGLL